jgi:hypothetical protein
MARGVRKRDYLKAGSVPTYVALPCSTCSFMVRAFLPIISLVQGGSTSSDAELLPIHSNFSDVLCGQNTPALRLLPGFSNDQATVVEIGIFNYQIVP